MIGDSWSTNLATEKFLVDNVNSSFLNCDVMVAPHHGADNGSSRAFIEAVSPMFVIFPAGASHGHPTKQAVDRYIVYADVQWYRIFRTDRGAGWISTRQGWDDYYDDDKVVEWNGQARKGCNDKTGDDDVLITVYDNGYLRVRYRQGDPCD